MDSSLFSSHVSQDVTMVSGNIFSGKFKTVFSEKIVLVCAHLLEILFWMLGMFPGEPILGNYGWETIYVFQSVFLRSKNRFPDLINVSIVCL